VPLVGARRRIERQVFLLDPELVEIIPFEKTALWGTRAIEL
jgi:hypothetical protein